MQKNKTKVDPFFEWMEWLNYEPVFVKERIKFLTLLEKPTYDEIIELKQYQYYQFMASLFNIYDTDVITTNEALRVQDFLEKEPIEPLMLKKLNQEELNYTKKVLSRYNSKSLTELKAIIKDMQNNFKSLSMVDKYIYHMTLNYYNLKKQNKQRLRK